RVIRVLEQVVAWRGQPQAIRLDNGPELLAERFVSWCTERGIARRYIPPGQPGQNAFIERFNRTYRTDVLDAYVVESLDQVREISAEWLDSYNEERPHETLAGLPPTLYRAKLTAGTSPLGVSPWRGSLQEHSSQVWIAARIRRRADWNALLHRIDPGASGWRGQAAALR
ncbi:MAG: integrase core domain-containing protein, partial [Nitrospirota bacterium]